jgi:PAS domain-containing protein
MRTQNLNEYINTINMLRVDIVTLKKDMYDQSQTVKIMQNQVFEKDKLLSLLEATSWDLPFPYWLKDMQSKMIYVNKQYESQFNIKSADYINKTDYDVWPKEIADKYVDTDNEVISGSSEYVVDFHETIDHIVIKWKRRAGNIVIGIAGICVPLALMSNIPSLFNEPRSNT